ncbi:sugar transferase [Winogradskyella helgolandensis]|uniref:sugar transferase n=1 Tax=Winogradskyella helgolandensis TaxID=2697010 RepID=UPI0015BA517C
MYTKFIKRIFDFLAAFVGLLIISPIFIFLIISLFILNNGKPFFYQLRAGKNGKLFTIIKFKTMTDKTDQDGNLLPAMDRVTKVGSICRKLSLDELPQLINIIKGDMSLIGPRPLLPIYLERYSQKQNRRHEVLPGITGWAQVNGRNAISWEQKFEYDVHYVENQSFTLDFSIILKTIDKVINRKDINNSDNMDMPEFKGSQEV